MQAHIAALLSCCVSVHEFNHDTSELGLDQAALCAFHLHIVQAAALPLAP